MEQYILFVLCTSDQGSKSSIILTPMFKSKPPFIIEKNPEIGNGVAYPRA